MPVRTLLSAAAVCCATFATAACAPGPRHTASIPPIPTVAIVAPAPAITASPNAPSVPATPATGMAAPAPAITGSQDAGSAPAIQASALFGMRIVALHNQVRWAAGVQPITWDRGLADAAASYAAQLARTGRWAHSALAERPGQGENLWMGTHAAFKLDEMVGAWADEGRMFHAGDFPAVSKTGNWDDVGHYTQMIWPGSIRVGCAERSSARYDYLVCRYSPAGNVMGSRVLEASAMRQNPPTALNVAPRPVTSNSVLD